MFIFSDLRTILGPPDPPTGVITSQHGSRWIQLSWTAPTFVGNSPITTYSVRYGVDTSYKAEITGNILSYNFTRLKPFTTYYFRVVVLNSKGSSRPADVSQKTRVEGKDFKAFLDHSNLSKLM